MTTPGRQSASLDANSRTPGNEQVRPFHAQIASVFMGIANQVRAVTLMGAPYTGRGSAGFQKKANWPALETL